MSFFSDDLKYENNNSDIDQNNSQLEVNKKNSEEFRNLMDNASTNYDGYWDKNNPLVKLILLVLFLTIVGLIIYFFVFVM